MLRAYEHFNRLRRNRARKSAVLAVCGLLLISRVPVRSILQAAGIEKKGLHSLRHTFATNLVNGVMQPDGSLKSLTPRQVADLLGHSTSEITELYYVKKDTARLSGITDGFAL